MTKSRLWLKVGLFSLSVLASVMIFKECLCLWACAFLWYNSLMIARLPSISCKLLSQNTTLIQSTFLNVIVFVQKENYLFKYKLFQSIM